MRQSRRGIVATVVLALSVWGLTSPATASEPPTGLVPADQSSFDLTIDMLSDLPDEEELIKDLASSPFPRKVSIIGGTQTTVYTLPGGLEYTSEEPAFSPRMSGGSNSYGVFVKFTPTEQDLIYAGAGFALSTAICLIPAVGLALCTVSGAIITAASVFIAASGKCSNRLLVYPFVPERNRCA